MRKANWKATSFTQGCTGLLNNWHCFCKGNHCVRALPLNEEPERECCKVFAEQEAEYFSLPGGGT